MPLWTNADTVAGKPAIGGRAYNEEYKRQLFATAQGWAKVGAGRATTGKDHEVLVAIRGLSTAVIGGGGATAVKANITSINWNISSWSRAAGGTLSITVNYNEAVDVVTTGGTPTIAVAGTGGRNHVLDYSGGTGTNRLTFIEPIAGGNAATNADDVLSVAAQNIAKNSGTIKDAGASTNAQIAISAGVGTAAGASTVVA